jgi:arylsulfatase A-like enzyme
MLRLSHHPLSCLNVSDNGAHNEGGHSYLFFNSSGPLRGFKRSLYEGGVRSPTMIRWPGTITPANSSYAWAFWDFMPTVADIIGVNVPNYTDGISILPTLLGEQQAPKDYIYFEFCTSNMWGNSLRKDNWKIVSLSSEMPYELYDLSVDLSESNNLAEQFPEIVMELAEMARAAHTDNPLFPVGDGVCVSS